MILIEPQLPSYSVNLVKIMRAYSKFSNKPSMSWNCNRQNKVFFYVWFSYVIFHQFMQVQYYRSEGKGHTRILFYSCFSVYLSFHPIKHLSHFHKELQIRASYILHQTYFRIHCNQCHVHRILIYILTQNGHE